MDKTAQNSKQVTGLLAALTVEFILGVMLTTVINYNPTNHHDTTQNVILIVHIVLGLGIVLGGIARLVRSMKAHTLQLASVIGLLSSLGAFGSGDEARRTGNATAVLVMSLCFILGFIAYGYSLFVLQKSRSKV